MYVRPKARGRQIGAAVLAELEKWAREIGHTRLVRETLRVLGNAVHLGSRTVRLSMRSPRASATEKTSVEFGGLFHRPTE